MTLARYGANTPGSGSRLRQSQLSPRLPPMTDEPTCGRGLAASAALPGKIAELSAALAEVLERHMKALDLSDEHSRREHALYDRLARPR